MNKISQMEPWFDDCERKAMADYLAGDVWLTEFRKTEEFSRQIAAFTGARHCIIVNNGTISMTLALWTAGLKPGDEVLVPDFTMIATANAATLMGCKPVFVDIEPRTLCLDLDQARRKLTPACKALIYVSFNGRCGDLAAVQRFCRDHNLFFLEDAAQSLGSFHRGTHLGRYGEIGSFSFSPPKIITTGQGGALITDDDRLAHDLKRIKDFGRERGGNDYHDVFGINSKFTDLQAVIGVEQMKKLPGRVARKQEMWRLYAGRLRAVPQVELIQTDPESVVWFVDIFVPDPDDLQKYLLGQGIESRRVYPPLHSQKVNRQYNHEIYPVSTRYASRGLWLPSSAKLSDGEINRVCDAIQDYYAKEKLS